LLARHISKAAAGAKPFPQGMKPNDSQALVVGAKAPTPYELAA
jgi:hypothetical protein